MRIRVAFRRTLRNLESSRLIVPISASLGALASIALLAVLNVAVLSTAQSSLILQEYQPQQLWSMYVLMGLSGLAYGILVGLDHYYEQHPIVAKTLENQNPS